MSRPSREARSSVLPVTIKAGAKGAQKAVVKVRYQACDKVKGICLPPKIVEVPVEFTVAAGAARPDKTVPDTSVPVQGTVENSGGDGGATTTPATQAETVRAQTDVAPAGVAGTLLRLRPKPPISTSFRLSPSLLAPDFWRF